MTLPEILAVIHRQRATGQVAVRFTAVFDGERLPLGDLHAKLAGDRWIGLLMVPGAPSPLSRTFFDRHSESEFKALVEKLFECMTIAIGEDPERREPHVEELTNATLVTQKVTAPLTFVRGGNA